ncbi:GPI biosynthesis protein family Pig-F-domain-containing protein [Suillus subalutaceus]|uniref:GPI biosynthesis protein family Pig-F-domain-containing protein n=1 Tax=Suillus subalutaceus TaxID=48586 RepID=UPI001B8664A7|nr:GPI biosynthesis protein family Pig-F-domain-containing protein [Suillus subalutaceus]KAG1847878.1 GPI biosynthesis protein family Pig-F-domain-containing protein [Suillus subalutaceus]
MPAKPAKTIVPSSTHEVQYAFFPYARYTSVVGVHTSLVAFTALFLPQTSLLLWPSFADSDRPQSQFQDALTDNPVITLAWIIAGLVILQVWWAGWIRQWCFEYTSRGGTSDEIKMNRYHFDRGRFSRLGRAAVFTSCVALVFHATIVLFGAPSSSHLPHTFLLAIVLALLSAFAPAYAMGSPSFSSDTSSFITRLNWTRLFAELSPRNPIERALVYPAVASLLGAWLGALPIALDWDRPWQAWPLTPLFGGIAGYIVGSLSALSVSALKWLTEKNIKREQSEKQKTT